MSDHIPDLTKMISDTPRTESVAGHARGIVDAGILAEGMKIERELNAANERIKRLEKAGDDLESWLDQKTPFTIRNNWSEAKEAKL